MTALDDAMTATIRVKGQQDRRRNARLVDQHRRSWRTHIDTDTMEPTVAITPDGWSAPFAALVPAQKYLCTIEGQFGELVIDYDRWITDWTDAGREYQPHLVETANRHFGAAAMRAIEEKDAKLVALAGPPPQSVLFVQMMKSGRSPWALGLLRADGSRYPIPEWAQVLAHTLMPRETYGGTGDLDADLSMFPEETDETLETAYAVADRYEGADRFADLEDVIDPELVPSFHPLPRARGKR